MDKSPAAQSRWTLDRDGDEGNGRGAGELILTTNVSRLMAPAERHGHQTRQI